jgi:hypothetical protein
LIIALIVLQLQRDYNHVTGHLGIWASEHLGD